MAINMALVQTTSLRNGQGLLCVLLLFLAPCASSKAANRVGETVLVQVGGSTITSHDLEKTLASSPFGVQFNAMNRNEQAALRGLILKRMVTARLLALEAKAQKISDSPDFKRESENFRKGLLYKRYIYRLRKSVRLDKQSLKALKEKYKTNPDTLSAARASQIAQRYRVLKHLVLQQLRRRRKVRIFETRIRPDMSHDTILLQGDDLTISYGDLLQGHELPRTPDVNWIRERLYQQAELELIADEAQKQGIHVEKQVQHYRRERLPALLRERLEHKWLSDPKTLRRWYKAHPQIGKLAPRWHIGQIVLATRHEAERLRQVIQKGGSLFELAGRYSIDPYGRAQKGDMGWLRANKAHPALLKTLKHLAKGEISPIIKTPKGYHILTLLDKRKGEQLPFDSIIDKVRQNFVESKMAHYVTGLQRKYRVVWKILQQGNKPNNDKS